MNIHHITKNMLAIVSSLSFGLLLNSAEADGSRTYVEFDGVGQYAQALSASAPDLDNKSFTIEFWSRQQSKFADLFGMVVTSEPAGGNNNGLVVGYIGEQFVFGWSGDFATAVPTPGDFGIWTHWACRYDLAAGTRTLFKNGDQVAEQVGGVAAFAASNNFNIATSNSGIWPFHGAIDELRVWGRALSDAEILERMGRALDAEEAGGSDLIAYYPFDALTDEGAGAAGTNDLADVAGGAHLDAIGAPEIDGWLDERSVDGMAPSTTLVINSADDWTMARELLARASLLGSDNVYLLDLTGATGTLDLLSPLVLPQSVVIQGPGVDQLTLLGDGLRRAFDVRDGATVVVRDLAMENFKHEGESGVDGGGGSAGYGGAIVVNPGGRLHCERVRFEGNKAFGGAGSRALGGGLGGGGARFNAGNSRTAQQGEQVGAGGAGGAAGANVTSSFAASVRRGGDAGHGDDGADGGAFSGGGGGLPGGGGGGGNGVNANGYHGGHGGLGGDGGDGGDAGFGAGAGAGGNAGGGGGGGWVWKNASTGAPGGTPGSGNRGGVKGTAGSSGFGAGAAGDGLDGRWGANAFYNSGNGGPGGAGQWSNETARGGGGGAGFGGAIFIHPRAALSFSSVTFIDNKARGGASGWTSAGHGRGIGSTVFLMDGARFVGTPDASFRDNTNTAPNGVTPDAWTDPIYGLDAAPVVAVRGGTHPVVSRPLYYGDASFLGQSTADVAFRYRYSLWAPEPTNGGAIEHQYLIKPGSGATDAAPNELFTAADRAAVTEARDVAENLFGASPNDPEVRRLLFDICFDSSAVLGFLAGHMADRAERDARNIDPVLQSSLDQHLAAYVSADGVLDAYREALACYGGVIADGDHFAALVADLPLRHFQPLQYVDNSDANLSPAPLRDIPGATHGYEGFKDLTLLFDLLSAYGDAGLRAAQLYLARDASGDRDTGRALAASVQRYLFTNGQLLRGAVPITPNPELAVALGRWEEAINSLAQMQTRLVSEINPLGFNDDFLLLVGAEATDSFQYLYDRLDDKFLGVDSFPVGSASFELDDAIGKFDAFNGSRTQFIERRADKLSAIDDRLTEIGSLEDPAAPPGDIDEQVLRIENARTEIQLNRTEVSNLHEEIRIAVQTNSAVKAANLTIADIKVNYIDRQRSLDREIAQLEAAQASADRAVSILDVTSYTELLIGGANMAFQGWADQQKIDIADRKADLAGAETLEIADAENVIRDAELDGFIKTRLLDLKRLALESMIATNVLTQELNRLAALIAESDRLEKDKAGLDASLADRYYADPVHGLRVDDALGRADIAFRRAQLWSFIAMRAFEYKWNQPFVSTPDVATPTVNGDGVWDKSDLFAARNARDLRDFASALEDRNEDFAISLDLNDGRTTTFRVRKDFFGLGNDAAAVDEFRDRLIELRDNDPDSSDGDIRIPFHTVRSPGNSSFFGGATYEVDPFGGYMLDDEGNALDKIIWVKVVIIGNFDGNFDPTFGENRLANSVITYGGTTYVRNIEIGTLEDPDDPFAPVRPDRLFNELTAYETRNYDLANSSTFPPQSTGNVLRDTGVEALVFDTSLATNPDPLADDAFANHKFAERSVAATDWSINLEVGDADFPVERIDEIRIIIHHQNYDRIAP